MDDAAAIEETLRAFYGAILRDQDYAAACARASPHFYLRPALYLGVNVHSGDAGAILPGPGRTARDAPRSCEDMARTIFRARGDLYPWRAWAVESVDLAPGGRAAEVVTSDGSAGLEKRDGRWLVLWAFDA